MSALDHHSRQRRETLPIHLSPARYRALWTYCKQQGHSIDSGIASLIDQNLNSSTNKSHG